jgi:hypothetical protein
MACSLPRVVVLKDSWPLISHKEEGMMFRGLLGAFGLPIVLDSYPVENGMDKFTPDDATYWPVFTPEPVEGVTPVERIQVRTVFETAGTSLREAKGPQSLVRAIVHAMLGT